MKMACFPPRPCLTLLLEGMNPLVFLDKRTPRTLEKCAYRMVEISKS